MKTVRFTELVKSAGKPEPYTLWVEPKKDRTFQSALKQHRVLSVHQETVGTKADYGNVGYEGDRQAQILVFPKSIQRFAGRRVVGVKYEMLEQPPEPPRSKAKKAPAREKEKKKAVPRLREPKLKVIPFKEVEEESQHEELDRDELVKGIRRAMRLLDDGKAVAAYRVLEELVD